MVLVSGIPVARWGVMKAEAFVEEEEFVWVDDNPDKGSLDWLEQQGLGDRLVVAITDQCCDDLTRVQSILAGFLSARSQNSHSDD